MLMGLAIDEDTKESKRGCEALNHAGGNALAFTVISRPDDCKGKIATKARLIANSIHNMA
jgi:hypothetical protein